MTMLAPVARETGRVRGVTEHPGSWAGAATGPARSSIRRRLGPNILLAVFVFVATVGLLGATPAAAETYDSSEECIEAKPVEVDPFEWRCRSSDGQRWSASIASPGEGFPLFGAFLAFAVLWSLVPFLIAASLARSRGESIGVAVLLVLVLGWIGLAIVYFGQSRSREVVEGVASRTTPAPSSPEERLRLLDRLHAEQLVGDEEFAQQRRRILDAL
jgi:hypothetical protein